MNEIHKKVIGNAQGAYFMILICIFLLFNKSPYFDHPFVKSHIRVAFTLHLFLLGFLFFMHYDIFWGIMIVEGIFLNHVITTLGTSIIFWGMLYGAYNAHLGKTIWFWEILWKAKIGETVLERKVSENLEEEKIASLILAHIPFIGYIVYPKNKELPHIRDINVLNTGFTFLSLFFFIIGNIALAQMIMLVYCIWSVFQIIMLVTQKKVLSLNTDFIPGGEKKYIILISCITQLLRILRKKDFISIHDIIRKKEALREQEEEKNIELLQEKRDIAFPLAILYIPLVGFWWLFILDTKKRFQIENAIGMNITFIIAALIFGIHSPILLLYLFPAFYALGYSERIAYKMPYIHDIYTLVVGSIISLLHILKKGKKLQKTVKKERIVIGQEEEKKEA